jgi:hypothetical protein
MQKYVRKPAEALAFCFDGTFSAVIFAQSWLSDNDIENVEVSTQGDKEPYALDVTSGSSIMILEQGQWLVFCEGILSTESAESFAKNFEALP